MGAPDPTVKSSRPPGLSAAACEAKRIAKENDYLKVIGAKGDVKFDSLRDKEARIKWINRHCAEAFALMPDRRSAACRSGFEQSVEAVLDSDGLYQQACRQIQVSLDQRSSCDKGLAACDGDLADGYEHARGMIRQAKARAKRAVSDLHAMKVQGAMITYTYGVVLKRIASKLKELKAQNKPLNDPSINTMSVSALGLPADRLMLDIRRPDMDPDAVSQIADDFDTRARTLTKDEQKLTDEEKTRERAADHGGGGFNQEAASAMAAGSASMFSNKMIGTYENEEQVLSQQISYYRGEQAGLNTASEGDVPAAAPLKSAPAGSSPAAVASPAPGGVTTANLAPADSPAHASSTSASSASRLPDFPIILPSHGGGGVSAPALLMARAPAAAASEGSPAPVPRVPTESSLGAPDSSFSPSAAPEAHAPAPAPISAATEPAATASPGNIYVTNNYGFGAADLTGHSRNEVPQRKGALSGTPEESDASDTLPPSPVSSASTAAKAELSARAESYAETAIENLERHSGPMAPSLRDILRRKLAGDYARKATAAGAGRLSEGTEGSTGAIAGVLREMRAKPAEFYDTPAFEMAASETEAEVRRMLGEESDAPAALGSVNVSLFKRIHEAHRRHYQKSL